MPSRAPCGGHWGRGKCETRCQAPCLGTLSREYGLSKRETEVLACLAAGRNAEYIARTLVIAPSTAKSHIAHIYRKTGFNSQQRLMDAIEERANRGDGTAL